MMFIPVMTLLITMAPPPETATPRPEKTVLEPYYLDDPKLGSAYRLYKRGNHKEAQKRLRDVIGSAPNNEVKRARALLIRSLEHVRQRSEEP